MAILKEMSTGRILDEACNHNNDAFGDEVLYAAWSAAPGNDAGSDDFLASSPGHPE